MDEAGLTSQARRLERSGYDGYPDEEDFLYLARASGVAFEICQDDVAYLPHYGSGPVSACLLRRYVYDGAGHGCPHYDLKQIYAEDDSLLHYHSGKRPYVPRRL